jgi:hypothetical protein
MIGCQPTSSYSGSLVTLDKTGQVIRSNDHSTIVFLDQDAQITTMEAKAIRRLSKIYTVIRIPKAGAITDLNMEDFSDYIAFKAKLDQRE